jgi:RNA polymerase sigma-70 factor (ECF subfamily)
MATSPEHPPEGPGVRVRSTSDRASSNGLEPATRSVEQRDDFERLYDSYRHAIYNLCARITGDRDEALDLTQEVFLKAYTSLPADEDGRRVKAWLYRVATNASLDHLRRRRRAPAAAAVPDELPSAVDGFVQAELAGLVERTLTDLSDRDRAALVLKDLHGLPTAELAGALGVTRGTADVIVHRARRSFKKTFKKLAGGAPAPASLATVLVPLTVPAGLDFAALPFAAQTVAPVAVQAAPAAADAAAQAAPLAGPLGGLLAKLAGSLTAKVAVGAAAATIVAGGGIALERSASDTPTGPGSAGDTAGQAAVAQAASTPSHHVAARDHWERHEGLVERHGAASHGDGRHGGSREHAQVGGHDEGGEAGHASSGDATHAEPTHAEATYGSTSSATTSEPGHTSDGWSDDSQSTSGGSSGDDHASGDGPVGGDGHE